MKELEFSTKLKEVAVTIDGKTFHLRELGGEKRDEYIDMLNERMTITDEGKVEHISKYAGIRSQLVSDSLFDSADKNVSLEIVGKFPSAVLQALFDKAQELSGISDEGQAKAKND